MIRVALTAFTQDGKRVPLLGRLGTTLAETLKSSAELKKEMEGAVHLSPSQGSDSHVVIPEEFSSLIPGIQPEERDFMLNELCVPGTVTPMSRLASKIVLVPEMNGMIVSVMKTQPQNHY